MEKRLKVLILGGNGMAGRTITTYFIEQGHDVTVFSVVPLPGCKNIVGDATDTAAFVSLLKSDDFDVVLNCIGMLNQACDANPALSVYLNSYLPHLVADTLKDTKTKLIHMSTDCVFSGKTGGYEEHSLRDGETFYDRTKALGEVEDEKNLTFRNSIVGPDSNENGIGLFNWFMKQSGKINGYTGAIWTGVTTLTLAKAMERAAYEDLHGIYNLVNNQTISKYELLKLFNHYFKNDEIEITPVDVVSLDKSLVRTRHDFSFTVPSYEQMVAEMKEWVDAHKELYPHYFK